MLNLRENGVHLLNAYTDGTMNDENFGLFYNINNTINQSWIFHTGQVKNFIWIKYAILLFENDIYSLYET